LEHKFVILRNGVLETYSRYEDIPESFDNLIEFSPVIPEGPHSEEQHDEIAAWHFRFKELMKRETK
jgi:hypothetical protein